MEKECCRCGYFKAYYTKAYCRYLREDYGRCAIKKEVVKKHGGCERWRLKEVDAKIKRGVILQNLANAVTTINVIKDFLDENKES